MPKKKAHFLFLKPLTYKEMPGNYRPRFMIHFFLHKCKVFLILKGASGPPPLYHGSGHAFLCRCDILLVPVDIKKFFLYPKKIFIYRNLSGVSVKSMNVRFSFPEGV